MESQNPFKILGIDQNIAKKLSDEDLAKIIKSNFRILQSKYHPDKGGRSDKTSKQLNEAYELLTNGDLKTYEYFKNKFLKTNKNKKDEEIARLEGANKNYSDNLINYFNGLVETNIFNPGACKIRLFDNAEALNANIYQLTRGSSKENFSYDLIINPENELFRQDNTKEKEKLENKVLIGTISNEVATENNGIKNILRLGKEIYTPEDGRVRYIHKISDKFGGNATVRMGERYENRINSQGFKNILPFIRPELKKWSYLFSVNKDEKGIFYSIDGFIRDIFDYTK